MSIAKSENQFSQFRLTLYQHFNNRVDALMDLVDALCSNTHPGSVVETSLNSCFRRDYNSLYKAIQGYQPKPGSQNLAELAALFLPQPQHKPFWLLGVDVTPQPRPYAFKLSERECVYQPTPIKGQKPITYGHQYSDVCLLPERESRRSPHWVIPLANQRVSRTNQEQTGAEQMRALLENRKLPFKDRLCVEVVDSKYSSPAYLAANRDLTHLVTIARVRSNRHFYLPVKEVKTRGRGHPTWYGKPFYLKDPTTQPEPDLQVTFTATNHQGKNYRIEMTSWHNLRMKGKCQPTALPMHQYPFTLVRISLYNDRNELVYAKPLWLIVMGQDRHKLSLQDIYEAYLERYDLEHFFRFTKQKMLLDKYQTPETEHEEHWWQLVHLAYLQLWAAQEYASYLPRPWERYLPQRKETPLSPAMVQRSFGGIMRQFGTLAGIPKRRGNSRGRLRGKGPALRKSQSLLVKGRH